MKKILQRVLGMVIVIVGLGYNFCYADVIVPNLPYPHSPSSNRLQDPMSLYRPSSHGFQEPATVNAVPIIIIGVVIAVIVVVAIIILAKSKKEKDKEKNDEK